jgi:hypothetical protein
MLFPLRLGIDCAQLFVRGRLVRLFTVFMSSIEAQQQQRAAVDQRSSSDTRLFQLKEHSTLKSLCCGKKNCSNWAQRAKFARGSVHSAARDNMVLALQGKASNIASRGSRAQSIPSFAGM